MKELTKAEEQIMQVLWDLNRAFVKEIIDRLPDPKPAYNTVSTIVRILQDKGFVGHETYGKSHCYYPLVDKDTYTRKFLKNFIGNYFQNSFSQMVSFFAKEENVDLKEL
ncbi:MAG: BlaI/MecI/CopY family transcriptional regulator, partial [Odoribacter splanchnicus]|nr:BlaI/MecI/CopY family transcriptional regulator [Odoribacter splanchnicus]